ncbi:MAG: metallophosphoesterase [Firmicutes bacterium]|nr:metallophosphoesterase [Bacillota bacterium]
MFKQSIRFFLPFIILLALLLLISGCQNSAQPYAGFTALYFSDTQADPATGDYTAWGKLLAAALEQSPQTRLILFGGDTVNDGGDENEWSEFWQASAKNLSNLTTAAVAGNHDSHDLLAQQFTYPQQTPPVLGEGFFYSFDLAQVHFIMLDSNIMGAARQPDIEWLRADLQSAAAQDAKWRIAVMHHPLWPVLPNPKDVQRAATMREYFLPLLETYGVDLVLTGHQHVYARSLPQSTAAFADTEGIVQIMAASGEKGYSFVADENPSVSSAPAPNYVLLQVDTTTITITAYNELGEILDTWRLNSDS